MKNILLLIGIVLNPGILIHAQSLWFSSELSDQGKVILNDKINNKTLFSSTDLLWINYNPVFKTQNLNISYSFPQTGSGISIFAVYDNEFSKEEQHVISVDSERDHLAILTSLRIADLQKGKFANFLDYDSDQWKLTSFTSNDIKGDKVNLHLFGLPSKSELPLQTMDGSFAELIVFDKAVSPVTKEIFESILSLKYGIKLSPFSKYRDEKGKVVLNPMDSNYGYRVGGLGKINSLHFNQKQSKTKIEKGFLSFSFGKHETSNAHNQSKLIDNSLIVWSDDNGAIEFEENISGNYLINRSWEINSNISFSVDSLEIILQDQLLNNQLNDGEKLWIKLENKRIHYLPLDPNTNTANLFLSEGLTKLNVYKASDRWVAIDTENADCNKELGGSARLEIFGFNPNSNIIVKDTRKNIVYQNNVDQNIIYLSDLSSGKYTINISDNSIFYQQDFYINDDFIMDEDIPELITIDDISDQLFDITSFIENDYDYSWEYPSGKVVQSSEILLNEEGRYSLTIATGNCQSFFYIPVVNTSKGFDNFTVYPNPSPDGIFRWEIKEKLLRPIKFSIHDSNGRIVYNAPSSISTFHYGEFYYPHSGVLFLTAESGKTIETKKIIIQLID